MDFNRYNKIWFTADTHFGHANIMKFCPDTRPWKNVHDMEAGLVNHWNSLVGDDDVVFIIGDFAFLSPEEAVRVLGRLNGTKVMVNGNHDIKNLRNPGFRGMFLMCKDMLEVVLDAPKDTGGSPKKVVMCHYPIWEWNQMHRGAFHIHGHVHGKPTGIPGRILDAGFDAHGKILSWEEVYGILNKKEVRDH